MPELEELFSKWRRLMLAAGVKTPVPLEELESHLRDDVEQRVRLGLSTQEAFDLAARQMGAAVDLKGEFEKLQPDEIMKEKIRKILCIISLFAMAWALILPAVAKWRGQGRGQEMFSAWDWLPFLIGVACLVWAAFWGLRLALKRKPA